MIINCTWTDGKVSTLEVNGASVQVRGMIEKGEYELVRTENVLCISSHIEKDGIMAKFDRSVDGQDWARADVGSFIPGKLYSVGQIKQLRKE